MLASHSELEAFSMKLASRSFSILASMIATRSKVKLPFFYATGLLAGLTWSRWHMMLELMREPISVLVGQDQGVLTQCLTQASNLLQGSFSSGFPRFDPSSLIAIRR
ncbi:hypothetical protein L3X38_017130 [Prunus dulcis]|uniref:Uncharacterized protein n=1 Tax=Prunus dulcis TaxID=3755 RepID=A0AAD4W6R8_PRUDU|nr:hypothetical protein L3X38_017130 [Prunus dulcis]